MVLTPELYRWTNRSRHLYSNFNEKRGYHRNGKIRIGEALHLVSRMTRFAEITRCKKEKLCVALSLFVS